MSSSSQKQPGPNCVDTVAGLNLPALTLASDQEKQMFDEGLGRSPLCLTIPGLGNSGAEHWQSIWERDRRDCERVPLGCWDQPSRNVWVGRIDQAVRAAPCPVVLVAHSLGCLAVVWWATMMGEATAGDVVGALLVAPPDVDASGDPRLAGFAPTPRALLPFPSVVVASRDDRWCGFDRSQDIAAGWGAEFVDAGDAGHLNGESGLGRWAEGQALLATLLNDRAAPVPRSALTVAHLAQTR